MSEGQNSYTETILINPPVAERPRTGSRALGLGSGHATIWNLGTALISALVALSLLTVISLSLGENRDIWNHLAATVLPNYLLTTGLLMFGVGLGTLAIGVALMLIGTLMIGVGWPFEFMRLIAVGGVKVDHGVMSARRHTAV